MGIVYDMICHYGGYCPPVFFFKVIKVFFFSVFSFFLLALFFIIILEKIRENADGAIFVKAKLCVKIPF